LRNLRKGVTRRNSYEENQKENNQDGGGKKKEKQCVGKSSLGNKFPCIQHTDNIHRNSSCQQGGPKLVTV